MRTIGTAVLFLLLAIHGAAFAQTPPLCATIEQCDAAIRANPTLANYERRGYLHLIQRRDREDLERSIADFSEALRFDAGRALSLYGRGMARLMYGDAAGQNEMEAAIMLQPNIDAEFKRYGAQ